MRRIRCATSTGSARARSRRLLEHGGLEVFVKVRSTRAPQRGLPVGRRRPATRSNWWTARTACRRARPACSTTARRARRVCWAAASSAAPSRRGGKRREEPHNPFRGRHIGGDALDRDRRSRRLMRAGRRSMTWCSARCSSRAARPRSRRPSEPRPRRRAHPRSRCRHRHLAAELFAAAIASSASTSPRRCCAGAGARASSTGSTNVEALAVMDAKHLACAGCVVRRRGGAVCHHRGAGSRRRRSTSSRACSSPAARSSWSITSAPRRGFRRAFEQGFSPLARRLGWSPEFPWARLTRWAER